ncbi:aromatic amino acid ammonia-lyase [Geobacillus stearothermophilus]|uniref:HAL/PAL/TAL family ammonia-lyase n=1 Tax=Geobacillus stearothermophilus TaxID=1422 RepID=UPI003D224675
MDVKHIKRVILGDPITIEEFIAVVRYGAQVEFSDEYCRRVQKSRKLLEQWIQQGRIMYGVNTGFGALCTQLITEEETIQLQKNILLSHAVSVGGPLTEEEVRATMLMVLQNLGQGYSGVRIEVLDMYRQFLNFRLTPFAPREGSVGYLSPEAHIALVLIGEGKAYLEGELLPGREALNRIGLKPITLTAKEGLSLISGTTGATALGALALYDMLKAATAADIIGAMTLEVLKGTIRAFDERLMMVRPHPEQTDTASNVRNILKDSTIARHFIDYRLQDALSLRCIPQLHGAAKKTLRDALRVIEIEMNSCCDNPILWTVDGEEDVISGGNADSSYVGIEMDSACIAATAIAKMSERRNNRLINDRLSEYPAFLISRPGLNSGLMIPQYAQAALLNDMKILSYPATVDNSPTCADQEDYVAMGYNAAKKAREAAEKLEYILAIELLSTYYAYQFIERDLSPGTASKAIVEQLSNMVPRAEEDIYLYPYIELLKEFIHSGEIIECVEQKIGQLK